MKLRTKQPPKPPPGYRILPLATAAQRKAAGRKRRSDLYTGVALPKTVRITVAPDGTETPPWPPQLHPCGCTNYNGGQCYNCLNGAHSICSAKKKCGCKNANQIGGILVFKAAVAKRRGPACSENGILGGLK